MSKIVNVLLATAMLILIGMGGAHATPAVQAATVSQQGPRFLTVSSHDDAKWGEFLEKLRTGTTVTIKADGGTETKVPGFNPETREVYLAALHAFVCQNKTAEWQRACQETSREELAAHNGWTGSTINETDLRKQARNGVYFPPVKGVVAQPVSTTTPVAPRSPSASSAASPAASEAAIEELRRELAAKGRDIEALKNAQAKAPTTAEIVTLSSRLTAEMKEREALERKLGQELRKTAEEAGKAATDAANKAVAPALSQAAAAKAATDALTGEVKAAADQSATAAAAATLATAQVATVSDRVSVVDRKVMSGFWALVVGVVLILGLAVWNYRNSKDVANLKALPAAVQQAFQEERARTTAAVDKRFSDSLQELALKGDYDELDQKLNVLKGDVERNARQAADAVVALAVKVDALSETVKAEPGTVTLPEDIKEALENLFVGQIHRLVVSVTGEDGEIETYLVKITRTDNFDGAPAYLVEGIERHDPEAPVKAKNLLPMLYRAGGRGGRKVRFINRDFEDTRSGEQEVSVVGPALELLTETGSTAVDETVVDLAPSEVREVQSSGDDKGGNVSDDPTLSFAKEVRAASVVRSGGRRDVIHTAS